MNNYKNIIFKGLAVGALALMAACSDDYLESSPNRYLEEDAVSETTQKDPSKVQAYINGAYYDFYRGGSLWTGAAHDDAGIGMMKLAWDMMCEDVAYTRDATWMRFDYQIDNRGGAYRRVNSTWNQLFKVIDGANSVITLLKPEEGQAPSNTAAKIMLGEAYSLRAYCYYYLINMWQHPYSAGANAPGIPVNTDIEYRQERVPVGEVYAQIISDLEYGYNYLKGEGYHNGKAGLSEYAAAAIYAEVLMFTGDYTKAGEYATIATQGGTLNSEAQMLSGFNSVSMPEVLWGYSANETTTLYYASFFSHIDTYMIGYGGQVGYRKSIASDLYNKIADNDIRKKWFGYNADYNKLDVSYAYEIELGITDYLQNKFRDVYITGTGNAFESALIYFRTGEMYFVAAEAYYLAGNEAKAREMLNTVMVTRIPGYSYAGSDLYNEICLQKRIDTWGEGKRLFDAKRRNETIDRSVSTNHAVDLISYKAITYSARDIRMIYKIPTTELENNPAITSDDDNDDYI